MFYRGWKRKLCRWMTESNVCISKPHRDMLTSSPYLPSSSNVCGMHVYLSLALGFRSLQRPSSFSLNYDSKLPHEQKTKPNQSDQTTPHHTTLHQIILNQRNSSSSNSNNNSISNNNNNRRRDRAFRLAVYLYSVSTQDTET